MRMGLGCIVESVLHRTWGMVAEAIIEQGVRSPNHLAPLWLLTCCKRVKAIAYSTNQTVPPNINTQALRPEADACWDVHLPGCLFYYWSIDAPFCMCTVYLMGCLFCCAARPSPAAVLFAFIASRCFWSRCFLMLLVRMNVQAIHKCCS